MNQFGNKILEFIYLTGNPSEYYRRDNLGDAQLSLTDAIGFSWMASAVSACLKVFFLAFALAWFRYSSSTEQWQSWLGNLDLSHSTALLAIGSLTLDLVFFPFLTLVVSKFWQFIMEAYGKLVGEFSSEEVQSRASSIVIAGLSSNLFLIIPFIGEFIQKLWFLGQIFVGLRLQFHFSRALSLCVVATPILILLILTSIVMMLVILVT